MSLTPSFARIRINLCALGMVLVCLSAGHATAGEPTNEIVSPDGKRQSTNEHTRLGVHFETGDGEVADLRRAMEEYSEAAREGDPEGVRRLSYALCESPSPNDKSMGFVLALRATTSGHPDALYSVGRSYASGIGVKKDQENAAKYYALAAKEGSPKAICALGCAYLDGEGVPKDLEKAEEYFRRAAALGDGAAMANLGMLLWNKRIGFDEPTYWSYSAYMAGIIGQEEGICGQVMDEIHSLAGEIRYRWISEHSTKRLAVRIGQPSEEVEGVLGKPTIQGSHCPKSNEAARVTLWHYPCGRVAIQSNRVVKTSVLLTVDEVAAGKDKQYSPTSWRIYPTIAPSDARYRALACSAILIEVNQHRHNLLGGRLVTPETSRSQRWNLFYWWGIANRNDLLQETESLKNLGHRTEFEKLGAELASLPEEEKGEAMFRMLNDGLPKHRLRSAIAHYKELGKKSLLGWDLARLVCLYRYGYAAGYVSEDEAWGGITNAANQLQATFDSWEDLGNNYMLGRQFWSDKETQESGDRFVQAFTKLTQDPKSPWKRCSWRPIPAARVENSDRKGRSSHRPPERRATGSSPIDNRRPNRGASKAP